MEEPTQTTRKRGKEGKSYPQDLRVVVDYLEEEGRRAFLRACRRFGMMRPCEREIPSMNHGANLQRRHSPGTKTHGAHMALLEPSTAREAHAPLPRHFRGGQAARAGCHLVRRTTLGEETAAWYSEPGGGGSHQPVVSTTGPPVRACRPSQRAGRPACVVVVVTFVVVLIKGRWMDG